MFNKSGVFGRNEPVNSTNRRDSAPMTSSGTALQSLTDAFLYLVAYPFECSEQLASRILGVAALRDVLTAFSAGKLTAESVAEALRSTETMAKSEKGVLIIPGMLSRMSGKLQEATGLKVIVGPKESSGIPKLLKSQ